MHLFFAAGFFFLVHAHAKYFPSQSHPENQQDRGNAVLCKQGLMAPTLMVIGCMKCGTSTIHNELLKYSHHKLIEGSAAPPGRSFQIKEKHFFDREKFYVSGTQAYFRLYPKCGAEAEQSRTGIDSSPSYIRELEVPRKVMQTYGVNDANKLVFVVMLRNPVARTFSEFFHNIYGGPGNCRKWCVGNCSECCTFDCWAAVQLEWADRVELAYGPGKFWPPILSKPLHKGEFKLHASFYACQIKNWLNSGFHPKQFVAVSFETYSKAGAEERKALYETILSRASLLTSDISELDVGESLEVQNSRARNREPMAVGTMERLRTFFAQPNKELYELLELQHITLLPPSAVGTKFLES